MAEETPPQAVEPIPPFVQTSALQAPTVFADAAFFCTAFNGVVRITFTESVAEPLGVAEPGWKGRHVGTLAMPEAGFHAMVKYLNDTIPFLISQGLIRAPE